MAKRFTDTNKWNKQWYRELGSKKRDVLNFLWDLCDHAGIWEIDTGTLSHFVGFKVTLEEILEWYEGRILVVDQDKVFIPTFIDFQYGELCEDSKPHQSVIKRLQKLTLWELYQEHRKGLAKGYLTLKDKEKEKDKEKDKEKEKGECEGKKPSVPFLDFESLYRKYPCKIGKQVGLGKAKLDCETPEQFALLEKAVDRFVEHHRKLGTEAKFIPHFSTFMTSWRDWTEPDTGSVVGFEPKKFRGIAELLAEDENASA